MKVKLSEVFIASEIVCQNRKKKIVVFMGSLDL